jgi:putative ATP-binding cassette transporter
MAAFSLIVKEFQRISTFAAVVERLGGFCEALDQEGDGPKKPPIETEVDPTRVAFERLTLVTPPDGRVLVRDLSALVPEGKRLLILGPKGSGRTSILRAAAGLWTSGQGRIVRPPLDEVVFLPQQPYLRRGSLREQLLYATRRHDLTDEDLVSALRAARLEAALERVGGLDAESDWPSTLSLGEQQQLAFARLLLANPRFAFLDEPTGAMKPATAHQLYEALAETPISYISVGGPELRRYHDLVVEIGPDGEWRSTPGVRALSA